MEESIDHKSWSELMLFPSTNTNKKGGPEYFLKVRQPTDSENSEEVEVADTNWARERYLDEFNEINQNYEGVSRPRREPTLYLQAR